jgi:hypothetical protein
MRHNRKGGKLRIRKHLDFIELLADNKRETALLREVFDGTKDAHVRVVSFGYDRKMPRKTEDLQYWVERQQLTLKPHKNPNLFSLSFKVFYPQG